MNSVPTPVRSALVLAGFMLVTFCAPLAGMFSPPGDWYVSLNKPAWNPPSWIFGPVWTALYLMMAVAAWILWRRDGWRRPLWPYFTQLTESGIEAMARFLIRRMANARISILRGADVARRHEQITRMKIACDIFGYEDEEEPGETAW